MDKDRFKDFDDDERNLVLSFENTVLRGRMQFFDVDELEIIIDYYFEVNDLAPLTKAVEYAEQLYPDSTNVRLRRAHLMIAHEQYDQALRIIQQLRRQEPGNTDIAYSLGVVYSALGKHRKAIDLFLQAAQDGWLLGRIYSNIAEEYYQLQDFNEAIRYYQLALDTDSYDNATIYNFLDTSLQCHRVDDAVSYLKSFVGEHPYSSQAWHCLGNAYHFLGLFELAVDAFEYAIAIDKTAVEVYADLALTLEAQGQTGEAVGTILRASEFSDKRSHLFLLAANVYIRAGNYMAAIPYLRKALLENPDDNDALAVLALALAATDDTSQALHYIKKALRVAPDSPDVLCSAASLYDMLGNTDMAADYFNRMVACDDCNEAHYQRFVIFLYSHQYWDTLIDFATESLDIFPHDHFYSTYLAAACFYTNRYNRVSRLLPDVNPALLRSICPQISIHPRLAPLIPSAENTEHNQLNP